MMQPHANLTQQELDDHRLWNLTGGKQGKRLVKPYGAYLGGADLGGADLGGAYLHGADLGGAYLHGAYLHGADLRGACLRGADLGGADLRGAYLHGADLGGADLGGADLGGADLGGACLRGACLRGACLRGAYLGGAYLHGADGEKVKLVGNQPRIALAFDHGYELSLWNTKRGVWVICGCMQFESIEVARAHWQRHENSQRQRVVLPALSALVFIASAQGWKI